MLLDDALLGPDARRAITEADVVHVSAATPWELGIKQQLGKLDLPDSLVDDIEAMGAEYLAITASHAVRAAALPTHHRDPFDRILIAQAQIQGLITVTADDQFRIYDVDVM